MPEASHRPYTPVPLTAVRIDGGFWGERLRVNRQHTLPAVFRQLRDTGLPSAAAVLDAIRTRLAARSAA